MRFGLLLLCVFVVAVVGCAGVEDTTPPPTELQSFEAEVDLVERWSGSTGGAFNRRWIRLAPAVDGDRLYTLNVSGELKAWNRERGRRIWRSHADTVVSAGVGLDADNAYVGTQDGRLIAFSREDGARVWERNMRGELLARPAAGRGLVVVRTVDGRVTALDPRDGSRLWSYSSSVPALSVRGGSSPIIVEGGVLVGLDNGRVVALEEGSGEPIWESTVAEPEGRTPIERMVDIDGSIGIGRQFIYAAAFQGRIVQIEPGRGEFGWSRSLSSYMGLNLDERRVYVTDQAGHVHALDKRDGSVAWEQEQLAWRGVSAPVPVPDTDWLVVSDRENHVHLLARDDGRILGRARIDGRWGILSDPVVADDGWIYIQGQGATVTAFEPVPRD
jgi:outer membrane protein assembly factor BamB